MLQADARILKAPEPRVFVEGYGAGGVLILSCSLWASHGEAGAVQRELIEAARHRLMEAGVESLVPLQILRTVPADADPSRLAASRTDILTRTL